MLEQSCPSQGLCPKHPLLQGLGWHHPPMGDGTWQAGLNHCAVKQDSVAPGLWKELGFPA